MREAIYSAEGEYLGVYPEPDDDEPGGITSSWAYYRARYNRRRARQHLVEFLSRIVSHVTPRPRAARRARRASASASPAFADDGEPAAAAFALAAVGGA